MVKSLKLVDYSLRNQGFSRSLPFVVMILMTMGIHHDVLFHMLSHVELSHEQRNALLLASLQLKTFLMLARCKRALWMRKSVGRNHGSELDNFQKRACFNMVDACNTNFGGRGSLRFYADMGKFLINGMDMPPLSLLQGNILLNPQQFWSILRMNEEELNFCKTLILFKEGLVLLENSSICPLFKNQKFLEKIFRIWKMKAFIGDEYGKPINPLYKLGRTEEDVMFIVLCSLAADTNFMKGFSETRVISNSDTSKMRMILYTDCDSAQGLDDSAKLVHQPCTIRDYINFFASRSYKKLWEPSFWYVFLKNDSRPTLVCRKQLDYERKFERFYEVFCMFWNNLKNFGEI